MDPVRVLALQVAAKALELADELGAAPTTSSSAPAGFEATVPEGVDAACAVFKAEAAKRFTLGVAYPAFSPDVAKAVDGFRDVASDALVEQAAWGYMRDHRQVGLHHFTEDASAGTVVESYIYRGPDWQQTASDGSTVVIKAGDWLLGTIWTPPAWDAISSGRVNGLSFVGAARRRKPSAETLARIGR